MNNREFEQIDQFVSERRGKDLTQFLDQIFPTQHITLFEWVNFLTVRKYPYTPEELLNTTNDFIHTPLIMSMRMAAVIPDWMQQRVPIEWWQRVDRITFMMMYSTVPENTPFKSYLNDFFVFQ